MRVLVVAFVLLGAALACGKPHPSYPLTEQSQPLAAVNARLRGSAPDVASSLTGDRLTRARDEPRNWLTYYGAYDAQRYSALDQVSTANVRQLRVAWIFQYAMTGLMAAPVTFSWQATPIVVDGVMFVSGPNGYVWALDAATGEMLWQYQHADPIDVPLCCGNVNRGVAVANGKVYVATLNGHLVALDARTGAALWETTFADVRAGESATLAPLVVKNMVLVGNSGGEYGVRGHIDAIDAETGRRVWRRYTVPKPGEPGSETWSGDSWERGGGAAWITGSYDPKLDLIYWGTSNPGPVFDGSVRRGDNLYTSSVVALDPDDGSLRWHYQWTPHDVWDYDGVGENILFDRDGQQLLAHFDKNGYLFVLRRDNGHFVRATRFADVTWGTVDERTGARTVRLTPSDSGTRICPGPAGAKEWNHGAFSPQTGLLYVPVVELCGIFFARRAEFWESLPYLGGGVENRKEPQRGAVRAFDPLTGKRAWTWDAPFPMVGSLLATGGGLLFAGEPTGMFDAFDARTGELLWQFQTGSGIRGSPITYSVDGKQYVAIASGWGGWMEGFAPKFYGAPRGNAIVVFSLP